MDKRDEAEKLTKFKMGRLLLSEEEAIRLAEVLERSGETKKGPTTAEAFATLEEVLAVFTRPAAQDRARRALSLLERRMGAVGRALVNGHRCGAQLCMKCDDAISAVLEIDAPPVFTLEEVIESLIRSGADADAIQSERERLTALRGAGGGR